MAKRNRKPVATCPQLDPDCHDTRCCKAREASERIKALLAALCASGDSASCTQGESLVRQERGYRL